MAVDRKHVLERCPRKTLTEKGWDTYQSADYAKDGTLWLKDLAEYVRLLFVGENVGMGEGKGHPATASQGEMSLVDTIDKMQKPNHLQTTVPTYIDTIVLESRVEQEVKKLIARNAKHKKKGTVMGCETWENIINHLYEEMDELDDAVKDAAGFQHNTLTPEQKQEHVLEEIADLYGIVIHAAVKAGFTVTQVEDRTLLKFKERFTDAIKQNPSVPVNESGYITVFNRNGMYNDVGVSFDLGGMHLDSDSPSDFNGV